MNYRLMFRSDFEDGVSKILLIQKMGNFNPACAATVSINRVLKDGSPLSKAVLSAELEIEFEKGQVARIGNFELEDALDFERDFTINLRFLSAAPNGFDILNAEIIE
jgi:hypothetical protein